MGWIFSRLAFSLLCLSSSGLLHAQGRTSSNVPVMFDNVRMSYRNGTVFLQWSNLTEREPAGMYRLMFYGDAYTEGQSFLLR
jgi:hypothetical protein